MVNRYVQIENGVIVNTLVVADDDAGRAYLDHVAATHELELESTALARGLRPAPEPAPEPDRLSALEQRIAALEAAKPTR